jgi:hypothetical protein
LLFLLSKNISENKKQLVSKSKNYNFIKKILCSKLEEKKRVLFLE